MLNNFTYYTNTSTTYTTSSEYKCVILYLYTSSWIKLHYIRRWSVERLHE